MRRVNFKQIRDTADIAKVFSCNLHSLNRLLSESLNSSTLICYSEMRIPKKNKKNFDKFRVVYKVTHPTLELLQKNISAALNANSSFPDCVQGFVCKRSVFTNAKQHLAKKYIINVDIKNFFNSISVKKVRTVFTNAGCNSEVANCLARICTLKGFLPPGASSSPVIANLVCKDMDEELLSFAHSYSLTYTRYADDITFSGDISINKEELSKILTRYGFSLNNEKFKIMKRGRNQYVTGLTVFDDKSPRIQRKTKRNLRLVLYYAKKFGLENHLDMTIGKGHEQEKDFEKKKIRGWIDYIYSIEPVLGMKWKKQWIQLEEFSDS